MDRDCPLASLLSDGPASVDLIMDGMTLIFSLIIPALCLKRGCELLLLGMEEYKRLDFKFS